MRITSLLPLLASSLSAEALVVADRRATDAIAGSATADSFPHPTATVNAALFPDESAVGNVGATSTGAEPAAIQTAASYASNSGAAWRYPLVADNAKGAGKDFDLMKHWGNLSPWYSVPSSAYGLEGASPLLPDSCSITQAHILYRHGARYPTGSGSQFVKRLANATQEPGGVTAKGELEFLNDWTYKMGSELLTPFGRLQEFELGLAFRQQYGVLLNNFTEQGTLPVFRTESQDRMVKTTQNFAAGFFGVPEFLDQVNIQINVGATGLNYSGTPYNVCPNSLIPERGAIGSTAYNAFVQNAYNGTIARLQKHLSGLELIPTDIDAMLQLCVYETVSLGYSSFCKLFTEEDFKNFDYSWDLMFYYNFGAGSPISAALGKGYLAEYIARLTNTPITTTDSAINTTLDHNSTYFPLGQSIYADAAHDVTLLDALVALNLTAVFKTGPLPLHKRQDDRTFFTSKLTPFATHFVIQAMECSDMTPTKQVRFIVNDAVIPVHDSYPGCEYNKDGLCAFDTVIDVLKKRMDEIDFGHDCYGNFTAEAGKDYNGRAPRS
ncbi:hypothetical protein IAT38_001067 [Cryptococcus sp. DSM 104549]